MKEKYTQKIKIIANKIYNSPLLSIVIGLIILGKTILFYKNTIAINEGLGLDLILGTSWFILILILITSILPNRIRPHTIFLINLFVSILLLCDNLYYVYASSFLSIAQASNLRYIDEIIRTIPSLLQLNYILYFLDIIIIIILRISKIVYLEEKNIMKTGKAILKVYVIFIIMGLSIFVGINYVSKGKDDPYNKNIQMRKTTIFGYHIYDIESVITEKHRTKYKTYDNMIKDYEELKEEYNTEYGKDLYGFEGILEGKNIIILQLESLQEFVVNKSINGTEITPNLNKFLRENITFSNMFMQSYSTTADSEHSVLNSVYPTENGMAYSKYYMDTYDNLFTLYNNANYYTSYMHGNDGYFWNRENVYKRLNLRDLSLKDSFKDTSEEIVGYLSDELLYRQAIEKIKQYEKPFISFIVSASSHTPFNLDGLKDRSKISIDVGEYEDTALGNYLTSANYADYSFGIFIDELKKEGLYDDTAILVFGDHNGLSMYDEELTKYLTDIEGNKSDVDMKLTYAKVLAGMKIPGIEKLKIDKPISKLDIKPTLTYLCNIEDGFSLGTNIFKNKDFVCLNNERIITDKYYYDENWYDIGTGGKIDIEEVDDNLKQLLDKYLKYMRVEIDISNSIVINNLLKQR